MKALSLVLVSLGGIVRAVNAVAAGMPECALKCLEEHLPKAGCNVLDIPCQCDPDFQKTLTPIIAPCLVQECDADEIAQAQNAFRDLCQAVPSTPKKEATASETGKDTSNADKPQSLMGVDSVEGTATQGTTFSSLIERNHTPTPGRTPIRTPPPMPKSTPSSTSTSTSSSTSGIQEATADPGTATEATKAQQPVQSKSPTPTPSKSSQGLTAGAKAGIGVGVSFGVVGMLSFAAALWLRSRKKDAPAAAPIQEAPDVGKAELPANPVQKPPPVAQVMYVAEIDGRQAAHELPA